MPGWRRLAAQVQHEAAAVANVRNCSNLDYAKGQLAVMDAVLNWPRVWRRLYDMAQAGDLDVRQEFLHDPGV